MVGTPVVPTPWATSRQRADWQDPKPRQRTCACRGSCESGGRGASGRAVIKPLCRVAAAMNFEPLTQPACLEFRLDGRPMRRNRPFRGPLWLPIRARNSPRALLGEQNSVSTGNGRGFYGWRCSRVGGAALIARGAMRPTRALRILVSLLGG